MNAAAQSGLVRLGLSGLLLAFWYTGAWAVLVQELTAGITGTGARASSLRELRERIYAGAPASTAPGGPSPAPAGLRVPTAAPTPTPTAPVAF